MTGKNKQMPKMPWRRDIVEKLKFKAYPATPEDQAILQSIFDQAKDVPMLAEALDWAKEHDIEFRIDHERNDVAGYYVSSAGIMVMTQSAIDRGMAQCVMTLTHELRHAWQDYHGLLRVGYDSFEKGAIQNLIRESEAGAMGLRADAEYRAAHPETPPYLDYPNAASKKDDLVGKFMWLFTLPKYIGAHCNFWFRDYSYYSQTPNFVEARAARPEGGLGEGMDIESIEGFMRLGESFNGASNYLTAFDKDVLLKTVLSPSKADTFWGEATDEQKKAVTELRKATIRRKLAQPKKKRPLP